MAFTLILLVSFYGIYLHWYNRFRQRRTSHTFFTYLYNEFGPTIAALSTVLLSDAAYYSTISANIEIFSEEYLQLLLKVFVTSYTIDSLLNKESFKGQNEE